MTFTHLSRFKTELAKAMAKHHNFPGCGTSAACIILEELGEYAQAYNDGNYVHATTELYHTMVTCYREILRLEGLQDES